MRAVKKAGERGRKHLTPIPLFFPSSLPSFRLLILHFAAEQGLMEGFSSVTFWFFGQLNFEHKTGVDQTYLQGCRTEEFLPALPLN